MALDRIFATPTVTVDQDKYDGLIKTKTLYLLKEEKEHKKELTRVFNFGKAIELLKEGKRVQREGWNGKNQYIELASNISYENTNKEIVNAEHKAVGNRAIAFVGSSGIQLGWLASQADMLAEDWKTVKEEN